MVNSSWAAISIDGYNSYGQRSNMPVLERAVQRLLALFPSFGRLRMMRTWGGVVDISMDGAPIIGKSPLANLYLDCGWCYGGSKATPASGWCFAHTIANDAPHPLNAAFALDRFKRGATVDEIGAGPWAWLQ
jgi:sarcosine oxidase subunit beta